MKLDTTAECRAAWLIGMLRLAIDRAESAGMADEVSALHDCLDRIAGPCS